LGSFDGVDEAFGVVFPLSHLNNSGASGLVLIDTHGTRRLSASVTAEGGGKIESFDADGKAISAAPR
jgi:hypothetical protein